MANNGQWCVSYFYIEAQSYNVHMRFIRAEQLENHKKFNKSSRDLIREESFYYFDTFEEALEKFNKLSKGKED